MMDKYLIEYYDEMRRRMIADWKIELEKPDLPDDTRSLLENLIETLEDGLNYTYSTANVRGHQIIVKHKRTEPRPLVLEEEQFWVPRRWWRKLTIWIDWKMNK